MHVYVPHVKYMTVLYNHNKIRVHIRWDILTYAKMMQLWFSITANKYSYYYLSVTIQLLQNIPFIP